MRIETGVRVRMIADTRKHYLVGTVSQIPYLNKGRVHILWIGNVYPDHINPWTEANYYHIDSITKINPEHEEIVNLHEKRILQQRGRRK